MVVSDFRRRFVDGRRRQNTDGYCTFSPPSLSLAVNAAIDEYSSGSVQSTELCQDLLEIGWWSAIFGGVL